MGSPHPDYLLEQLNKRQVYEWLEYSKLHPFGQERDEFINALMTWHMIQAWVEGDEREPKDLLPKDDRPLTEAETIANEILESL